MQLVLEDKDLAQIDAIIKKTPFEYSYPLFQLLTNLINAQNAKVKAVQNEQVK